MKFSVSVHVLIGFLLGASTSHGQTIVQHLGAHDPLDAGFVLNPIISDPPGYAELEAVFNDFGFDAWSINAIRNSVGFYTYYLSSEEENLAATQGWILTARLRLVDVQDGPSYLHFFSDTARYRLRFSMDANGDPVVAGGAFGEYTLIGGAGAYHEFSLVYDVASELAALWVNGVEVVSNIPTGSRETQARVFFGGGESPSHAHWNEVTFTAIPEPATVAFLAGVGALIVVASVRLRRRKLK